MAIDDGWVRAREDEDLRDLEISIFCCIVKGSFTEYILGFDICSSTKIELDTLEIAFLGLNDQTGFIIRFEPSFNIFRVRKRVHFTKVIVEAFRNEEKRII